MAAPSAAAATLDDALADLPFDPASFFLDPVPDALDAFWAAPVTPPAPRPAPAYAQPVAQTDPPLDLAQRALELAARDGAARAPASTFSGSASLPSLPHAETPLPPVGGMRKPGRPAPGSPVTSAPAADRKRLQHNRMMRANRERANARFALLENLLREQAAPPMRNKMQVLDAALAAYPASRARAARLRARLLASSPARLRAHLAAAGAGGPPGAAARLALAAGGWAYAEVCVRGACAAAFVGPGNSTGDAARLARFASRGRPGRCERLASSAARAGAPVWCPDVREGAVATGLFVPVPGVAGGPADAVVALYSARAEEGAGGVRKYDAKLVEEAARLAEAVRDAR